MKPVVQAGLDRRTPANAQERMDRVDPPVPFPDAAAPPGSGREPAVDAFRGLTMAFMVLVNNPGDYLNVYPVLHHAAWHGWTPVDVVYPCFLFIVGVSLWLSLEKKRASGMAQGAILGQVTRRCLILVVLGLFDNAYPFFQFETLRFPGVLQRIGIVCLIITWMLQKLGPRSPAWTIGPVLLAYWALMTLAPVPMHGPPDLALTAANFPAWLDHRLMEGHLWLDEHWDPEGILSTFPALCVSLFGVLAARRMVRDRDASRSARAFLLAGLALLAGGGVWNAWFPINRWLWTSSFILLVSGWAFLLLAACLAASRKLPPAWLTPLRVYGANAITIYLGSDLLSKTLYIIRLPGGQSLHALIHESLFTPWLAPKDASLAWALAYTLLFLGLGWVLYARRIIIKV